MVDTYDKHPAMEDFETVTARYSGATFQPTYWGGYIQDYNGARIGEGWDELDAWHNAAVRIREKPWTRSQKIMCASALAVIGWTMVYCCWRGLVALYRLLIAHDALWGLGGVAVLVVMVGCGCRFVDKYAAWHEQRFGGEGK